MSQKAVPTLIPMGSPGRAKGRLASVLNPAQRMELAFVTLGTVVAAVEGAGLEPIVLTPDPAAISGISRAGVMAEAPQVAGLNEALEAALRDLGSDVTLVLHADLPLVTSRELERLMAALDQGPAAALVRSRDGGTNAMLMSPPRSFRLSYGPGSFRAHVAAAFKAGLAVTALSSADLELDLDTAADIDALLSTVPGRESAPGRLLLDWGLGGATTAG